MVMVSWMAYLVIPPLTIPVFFVFFYHYLDIFFYLQLNTNRERSVEFFTVRICSVVLKE